MARDTHHAAVKAALIKDGWRVTDDPLHIRLGVLDLYIDMGVGHIKGRWHRPSRSEASTWLCLVPEDTWSSFFSSTFIQDLLATYKIRLIVCDTEKQEIHQWISS